VLDVNNAFSNNLLQFNPQFQALSSLANQQTATNGSLNFTDMLAIAQAESEQIQNGTSPSSVTGQQMQAASSPLNFIAPDQSPAAGSSSSYQAEQGQTPNQSAANTQNWRTNNSDPAPQASSPVTSSAAADTAGQAAEADTPEAVASAYAIHSTEQTVAPFAASANFNLKGPASAPTPAVEGSAAGSASPSRVVTPDAQGEAAPAQKILEIAPMVDRSVETASASIRPATNQKASATISVAPDQQEPVNPSMAASAKSSERVKGRKETATEEAKNNAGSGIAGGGSEPVIAATQNDPISSPPNATTTNANASDVALKSHNAGKIDPNSNLAFALKIQGNDPISNSGNQVNLQTMADIDHADPAAQTADSAFSSQMTASMGMLEQKTVPKSGLSSQVAGSSLGGQLNLDSPAAAPSAMAASSNASDDSKPAEESVAASSLPEDQAAGIQPVKTVQVQINGADDQKVDLKLVEKSGALTMSVRSSDAALTKSLQQNLPDLTTRLSDQQIRAEWWRPDTQQPDLPKNSGNSSSGGNSSANQDQGNQNKGNSGQQGGRSTPQPEWLEDLSSSKNSTQNGTQFTWHL